ncbi:N-acyl-D-amino-acid deacylase family protein [Phytoactinopolyspora limicola]|uniref:N-acyl-D-amino-acid deacylase family protein n=1 Tax=Phytoactinopolyspora limicola TaxID=2715536 RepID=UPI00140DC3BB|nr:D-aminoacylase [Phytoactinopolyspora limicola]
MVAGDLLIRGGTVVDGTGAPPVEGDLLVVDGRIEAVLRPHEPAEASQVIDAAGLVVAPGFIDIHTHSDVSVLLDGRAQSKVHQGVTTEVVGNCGFSAFPIAQERRDDHADLLAGIGDDPVPLTWSDLDGYADVLQQAGLAVNVATLVGHGQLRIAAAGMAEQPSVEATQVMGSLLRDQLEQGAFGLSTGLTYVPSRYADTAELSALCAVLARHGALYATHSRGSGFTGAAEAAELGRVTGAAIQYSHIALNDPQSWGRAADLLALFDDARRSGVDIACDVYPYHASASALTQYLPAWVQEGGIAAMRSRLADGSTMDRAERELAAGWGAGGRIPWYWDRVLLSRTDGLLGIAEGVTVDEAASSVGMSAARLVLELCREGGNRVQVVLFYRTEDDMREFLRAGYTLVGSDGSALPYELPGRMPHPRAYGAHARVLGRYTRELGDLDLATAVHKMTGAVAQRMGLADRGTLRRGLAADVVVFDPATVNDEATYLDPCRAPSGVHYVVVNGEVAVAAGTQTEVRSGRVLRSR